MTVVTTVVTTVGAMTDITEILRDIATGKTNVCGDHWSPHYCEEAAKEIERLRNEIESMHEDAAGESI